MFYRNLTRKFEGLWVNNDGISTRSSDSCQSAKSHNRWFYPTTDIPNQTLRVPELQPTNVFPSFLFLLFCSVLTAVPTGIKKSVPPAQTQWPVVLSVPEGPRATPQHCNQHLKPLSRSWILPQLSNTQNWAPELSPPAQNLLQSCPYSCRQIQRRDLSFGRNPGYRYHSNDRTDC